MPPTPVTSLGKGRVKETTNETQIIQRFKTFEPKSSTLIPAATPNQEVCNVLIASPTNPATLNVKLTLPYSPTGDPQDAEDVQVKYEATFEDFKQYMDDTDVPGVTLYRIWDSMTTNPNFYNVILIEAFSDWLSIDPSQFTVTDGEATK